MSKRRPRSPAASSANSVRAWCRGAGIGTTTFYMVLLKGPCPPKTVKAGDRTLVLEEPLVYLDRLAAFQKQQNAQQAAA